MNWIDFPDSRLTINGLAWFDENKPQLYRLPIRLESTFRKEVWSLGKMTAGGRIRFKTNSLSIGIRAVVYDENRMNNMSVIGQSGFDIWVNGRYINSVWPEADNKIDVESKIATTSEFREIVIYMPSYNWITINQIGLDDGAIIEKPSDFVRGKPVVFYGSSITQGGCASNPGTSYQNFLSRWLNIDYINLGFSGQGMGDLDIAHAINEIDASCVVFDYWANIGYGYGENLPEFTDIIRSAKPDIPILVVCPFYQPWESFKGETYEKVRKDAKAFVQKRRRSGDKNIHFADGLKMITEDTAYGLVDGTHPNSLGFYYIAKGFMPYLKRILGL